MSGLVPLLAGLLSGLVGAMGLGGGGVFLIYLTVFAGVPQLQAQGMNLLFFIPCGIVAVCFYAKQKRIRWRTVLRCALFGLSGSACGAFLAGKIGSGGLSKVFAVCLLAFGVWELLKRNRQK